MILFPNVRTMQRRISPAALPVLVAAMVGGVLPLARPGALVVGISGLAVVPLAALVLAGPARAATITAAAAYVVALMWAYATHFSPLFAYRGLIDARPDAIATLIVAGLAALPAVFLPVACDRPSTIVLWFLYMIGYVPTTVVSLFLEGDLATVLPFDLALAGSMAFIALILRLPLPRIPTPHLSLTGLTRFLVGLGLLVLAYVVVAFGVHSPPSLANVYSTRADFNAELGAAAGSGYIVDWAGNVIYPMLMALGLARKRAAVVLLGVLGQVLIYGNTGAKGVLFSLAVVPLVYLAISAAPRSFGFLAVLAAPVIIVFAVIGNAITGDWSLALATREFASPGQVGWYYFDYFTIHPPQYLSHSFLSGIVPSLYTLDPPTLIGSVHFPGGNTHANAGLWADAFANFRFVGIVAFTAILALVLRVADGLGQRRDARVAGPVLAIAGLNLAEGALFTNILTHGLWLCCVLLAIMPLASSTSAAVVRDGRAGGP